MILVKMKYMHPGVQKGEVQLERPLLHHDIHMLAAFPKFCLLFSEIFVSPQFFPCKLPNSTLPSPGKHSAFICFFHTHKKKKVMKTIKYNLWRDF